MPDPVPGTPTLQGLLGQIVEQAGSDLKAVDIGVVVNAWNRTDQTANVQPVLQSREGQERPVITNVPVIFPGVSWDLQIGETGVLLFGDLNPRRWWRTGTGGRPEGVALHDIGNALFLPGLRSQPEARTVPVNAAVVDKPVAGGTVRLGTPLAFKAAVHEDLVTDLNLFLNALDAWGGAVGPIVGVPWNAVNITIANILGGSYTSPSVKVED